MSEKTWGMRFNEHPDFQHFKKGQLIPGCPDWLETHQIDTWQEPGLIIWNNIDKKIKKLNGQDMLRLLDQLNSLDNWKSEGVSITQLVYVLKTQSKPPSQRKQNRQDLETGLESVTEKTKAEPFYKEVLRLPPEAGPELLELLQTNHQVITKMVEQEKKQIQEARRRFFEILLESSRRHEASEFQSIVRPLTWKQYDTSRWLCQLERTEAHICLEKNKLFWHACVKKSGLMEKSNSFSKLLEAADWVEKELVELENQPETPEEPRKFRTREQSEADHARLVKKLLNSPYWIDPAKTEPERITYRIFIELDAQPASFETYESMCGDTYRLNERYLSPSKLSGILNLDVNHFQIKQPISENSEWYLITSLTIYYQEASAAEQAQKVWDQSQILQQFKLGKIIRARYGYQEVETGFVVFLGACEAPAKPWVQPATRSKHMEELALRESLCFALDINDYRDFLGLSSKWVNDEELLEGMHEIRTRSKFLPEEAKRESKIWLAKHGPLE
jgi:hypothetical protein